MTTAIYCRASSSKQQVREDAVKGSVDQQLAECKAWAEKQEIKGPFLVLSEVKSATKVDAKTGRVHRPRFNELRAGVRSGQIDYIIAYDSDRITRDPMDGEEFLNDLAGSDVIIDTLKSGKYQIRTAEDRFIARILFAAARRETEKLSERVLRGKKARMEAGLPRGIASRLDLNPAPSSTSPTKRTPSERQQERSCGVSPCGRSPSPGTPKASGHMATRVTAPGPRRCGTGAPESTERRAHAVAGPAHRSEGSMGPDHLL
ncbi:recombinase family protein [Pseudonocardia sp. ICBG601]|uniref:recombinase family protein n=1 Tax=Pseudonocardia sp. ICBG601 TaxID=2846759 RepID=UPI001CF695EF